MRLALSPRRMPQDGVRLARRRRQNEVEGSEVRSLEILERVGLQEDVAAIVGLRLQVDANDVEACLLQTARRPAGAAE